MNVGAELAQARRNLGLSLEEVSDKTKISVERLSAIEEMDAERLPSLIYLKGFVRAYAAEVELDPDQTTNRYLGELDGVALSLLDSANRSILDQFETETPRPRPPADVDDLEIAPPVPLPRPGLRTDRHQESRTTDAARRAESVAPLPASSISEPRFFAAYVPETTEPHKRRSPVRVAAMLFTVAIAVLTGWWIGANYDAIAQQVRAFNIARDTPEADRAAPEARAPDTDAFGAARPERPDGARGANTPASVEPDPARATTPDPIGEDASRAGRINAPSTARAPAPPTERATEPDALNADRAPDAEPVAENAPGARTDGDLSGSWTLTNRIESSTYKPFNGMNVGFHLTLQQDGNRVTGTGQKWMENGRPLPPGSRTPIAVEGTLQDRRLELAFTERGPRRTSAGTLVLDVTDQDTLSGTFASDAANAQGTSLARRIESPRR